MNSTPDEEGENNCQEFWNSIEGTTGFVLPAYIRNVLKFHGFDNAMSVKLIDEEDIRAIENFTKSDEMLRILTSDAKDVNLKDYYGPFVESKPDFQILRGHRKVLMGISTFIREKGTPVVCNNVKRIKNSGNDEHIDFQSIKSTAALDLKDDFVCDNSVKSNDINVSHLPVTETRSVLTPRITTPLDKMDRSSEEDVPIDCISFKSTTKDREMAKITVRRKCVLHKPYSHQHPNITGWPQKDVSTKSNDNKDVFNTSAVSDFKFTNPLKWSNDSVKNDDVGLIHRTPTTPRHDVTDKWKGSCEENEVKNDMPFESTMQATDSPKITVRRKCVQFKSSSHRYRIDNGWPEKGIKAKSKGNEDFFNVSTQNDCKLPKMDSIARNQNVWRL